MNEFLNYQIKVPLHEMDVDALSRVFIWDVQELPHTNFLSSTINDIIIFQFVLQKTVLKLEMDNRRKAIEGYVRKKPYMVKLTKPQIYWLYKYIESAELIELDNLKNNILGRYIVDLIDRR